MNPFFQALESGYDPEEILGYVSKSIPAFMKPISKAKSLGYPAKQILGFLSKNFDTENRKGMSESERHAVNRRADAERTKFGLKVGVAAAASPVAARVVGNVLSRALPNGLNLNNVPLTNGNDSSGMIPHQQQQSLPNQKLINPTEQQQQNISSQPPVNAPTIPQTQQISQPINAQRDIQKNIDIIKNVGADIQVKNLIEGGLPTQDIAGALRKILPKEKIKALESAEGGLEQAIEDMRQSPKEEMKNVEETQIAPQELQNMEPEIQELDVPEETPKIDVKSIVGTPNGIGEVKAIRNGKTIVEVDGKRHQINEDELIASPLPEKDLADLYDDVISRIEKETGQQVSRNVDWAGYDPKTKELAYKPHGSDRMWTYDDLTQEDVDELTNLLTQRKTTGENYIGAWESGSTSPIGAALSKLIQRLQKERGGKGNEYRNRYDTIYDALAPAKSAAKRKHAEEKRKAKKPKSH